MLSVKKCFRNDFLFALQVLLLLCYPVVLPGHLSQHAKAAIAAIADGQPNIFRPNSQKKCRKFKSVLI
jgi:hypothetical protein